jgi:hypothetical protein
MIGLFRCVSRSAAPWRRSGARGVQLLETTFGSGYRPIQATSVCPFWTCRKHHRLRSDRSACRSYANRRHARCEAVDRERSGRFAENCVQEDSRPTIRGLPDRGDYQFQHSVQVLERLRRGFFGHIIQTLSAIPQASGTPSEWGQRTARRTSYHRHTTFMSARVHSTLFRNGDAKVRAMVQAAGCGSRRGGARF